MDVNYFRDRTERKPFDTQLFTLEEKKAILETRRNLENRIRRNEKEDFVNYIQYELSLWIRTKAATNSQDVKFHKEVTIKVIKLHNLALIHYKDDLKLWLSYIKFCMWADDVQRLSDAFEQMLLCHTDEHLWLLAAKWELDENNEIKKSLNYLHRGLSHHPKGMSIYIQIFKTELQYPEFAPGKICRKTLEHESELRAIKIYEAGQKELPDDVHFYLNLLEITADFPYAIRLQTKLVLFVIETFPNNEMIWNHLAKREMNGYHLTEMNTYLYNESSSSSQRFLYVVQMYRRAVALNQTERMWSMYLSTLLELQKDKTQQAAAVTEAFKCACTEAHKANLLTEEHYVSWFALISTSPELPAFLQQASEQKPNYLQIWLARIRYHMLRNEDDRIEAVFADAVRILDDHSTQIWRLKIQYYQMKENVNAVEAVYKNALEFSTTVAMQLKPQFLEWVVLFKTIEEARGKYKWLAPETPWCFRLHTKMAELEAMCPEPSQENMDFIYNVATNQFGIDKWMEYVKEEVDDGPQWKREVFTKYFLNKTS